MGKYIDHRLVARPEPNNTFCIDNTAFYNGKLSRSRISLLILLDFIHGFQLREIPSKGL